MNPFEKLGMSSESCDYSDKVHSNKRYQENLPQQHASIHKQFKKETADTRINLRDQQVVVHENKVSKTSFNFFKCFGK